MEKNSHNTDEITNCPKCHGIARRSHRVVRAGKGIRLEVAEARGWEPFGLEINPYSCGELRKKYGDENVFEGQLTECEFPSGYFSVITMTDVIEHVLDIKGTLSSAANLLTEGGMLCITTPQIDSISRRLMRSQWFHFKQEHIQYFSRKAIQGVLEETGFADIKISLCAKCLTLDYLTNQLCEFPHIIFTPLVRASRRIFPRSWHTYKIKLYGGEMLIRARKSKRSGDN